MQNGLVATFDLKPRPSCHMLRLDRHAPTRLLVSATAVVLLTILSTLAAAAIVHYPASVRWITAGAAVLITYIQLHTWRARLDHIPLAAIVLVALNVVAILGQLFYRRVADVAAVSATLSTDAAVYRNAAVIFAAASLAFWIGGLAGTIGVERGAPVQRSDHGEMLTPVARPKVFPTMMASSIPLVLGVIGFSVQGLLRRPNYLHTFGPTVFVKLAYILVPMGLAGAALLLFNGQQRRARFGGLFLLLLYLVYLFSIGSRAIALVPLLLCGTYLLLPTRAGHRRRIGLVSGLLVSGLTLFLFQLPLALRDGTAGLVPYSVRIWSHPGILWPSNPFEVIGNVLFSVPLAGYVATTAEQLPMSYFLTAVTPLPGSLTSWSAIKDGLRLNSDTPFNTLGELALHGMPVLIGYFLVVGFIATHLQIQVAKLIGVRRLVGQLVVAASLALFAVSILQYNLRSSTRLLWYAVVIVVVLRLTRRLVRPALDLT